jgi:hypothetical protein
VLDDDFGLVIVEQPLDLLHHGKDKIILHPKKCLRQSGII